MERPQRNGQASKLADHFVERLHGWAEVSIRSLFGSIALCREEIVFALVWQGELYLKADTSTRATFEAEGSRTLTYISKGKEVSLKSFMQATAAVVEDDELLHAWAELAFQAARRNRRK